jgi:hypothetical protein
MITLEVMLNGKPLCRAGVGKHGVVSAITTWVNRAMRDARGKAIPGKREEMIDLSVSGLVTRANGANVRVEWARPSLKVGDEIWIRVVEGRKPTKAQRRERDDPNFVAKQKRRYYERLRQEHGEAKKPARKAKVKARKRTEQPGWSVTLTRLHGLHLFVEQRTGAGSTRALAADDERRCADFSTSGRGTFTKGRPDLRRGHLSGRPRSCSHGSRT